MFNRLVWWWELASMEKPPLKLRMEHGPSEGQVFPATHLKRVNIGRTRTNNYQIKDPTVSQKHAVIEWRLGHWTIVDVGSSNGTDVNGVILDEDKPIELKNGDLIRFGEAIKVRVLIQQTEQVEVMQTQTAEQTQTETLTQTLHQNVEQPQVVEQTTQDEEIGMTVEEWFESELSRVVQAVRDRADVTTLEMSQSMDQLKQQFREYAGVQ